MVLIYLVSEHTRSRTFFHDLKSEAVTKAHLFLQNQVDAQTMQSIYLNNKKFINEVEVAVYSIDFRMLITMPYRTILLRKTMQWWTVS